MAGKSKNTKDARASRQQTGLRVAVIIFSIIIILTMVLQLIKF
jgi:hypothetical protein